MNDDLEQLLKSLHLRHILEALPKELQEAEKHAADYVLRQSDRYPRHGQSTRHRDERPEADRHRNRIE